MVLLTGLAAFAGVLISWRIEDRTREFFRLFSCCWVAGVYGVFRLAGYVPTVLLVRVVDLPHVPVDCNLGVGGYARICGYEADAVHPDWFQCWRWSACW